MADATTLHEAALACRKTFVALIARSAHVNDDIDLEVHDEDDWAEARLADFNLWASGSGALSDGRTSLDNRLRLSPNAKTIVYRSLRMLEAAIQDCSGGGEHEIPASSFALANDARPKRRSLRNSREIVDRLLAQLYRLTLSIRASGAKSRLERADRQFEADRYEDLQRDLVMSIFLRLPKIPHPLIEETALASREHGASAEDYPDLRPKLSHEVASPDASEMTSIGTIIERFTEVQKRLIDVNLRRRNRFICAQRHSRRLQKQRQAPKGPHLERKTEGPVSVETKKQKEPTVEEHFPALDKVVKVMDTPRSESLTTDPTMPEEDLKVSAGSQPPMTVVSSTSLQATYPNAPYVETSKHTVFRCPCCCVELPILYLERSKWRKHLSEDVRPYTCVLPNCPQSLRMYRTRREWEHHMEQEHQTSDYWVCQACNPTSKWQNEPSFETHLRKDHKSTINAASISTFLKACRYRSPEDLTSCPLCPPPLETEVMEPRSLFEHTAIHIHDFSMKSLPWEISAEKERAFVGISEVDYFDLEENPYFATDCQDDAMDQNRDSLSKDSTQSHSLSEASAKIGLNLPNLDGSLNLLSLDGGGIRGLSSLLILEKVMLQIDEENPPKPCDYFDMIGGTSTGGLIAIMLGRLHMDVAACIDAYNNLMDNVFGGNRAHGHDSSPRMQARFDTDTLEKGIKSLLMGKEDESFHEELPRCKVFVCATSAHNRKSVLFTNYPRTMGTPKGAKIWEVARATSAEPAFFERIHIGSFKQAFLSGSTGANNPVSHLWSEAEQQWGQPLANKINCLVSIGTGEPTSKAFGNFLPEVWSTLEAISRDAESSARHFINNHLELTNEPLRYFRFNVTAGLGDVGLEVLDAIPLIASATDDYLEDEKIHKKMLQLRICLKKMKTSIVQRSHSPLPQWIAEQQGQLGRVLPTQRPSSIHTHDDTDRVMPRAKLSTPLRHGIPGREKEKRLNSAVFEWLNSPQNKGQSDAVSEHDSPENAMLYLAEPQAVKNSTGSPSDNFSLFRIAPASPSVKPIEPRPPFDEKCLETNQPVNDKQISDEGPPDPGDTASSSAVLPAIVKVQLRELLGTYADVLSQDAPPPAPTSVVNRAREERAQGILLSSQFNISRFFSGAESSVRLIEDDMSLRKGGLSTDFIRHAVIDALNDEPAAHVVSYRCSLTRSIRQESSVLKDMMRSLILQLLEISDLEGFQPRDDFVADDIESLYSLFGEVASRASRVRCFCIIDRWTALEENVSEGEVVRALETLFNQMGSSDHGSGKSFNLLFTDVRKCNTVRQKLSSEANTFSVHGNTGRGFRRLARPSFQAKLRESLLQASQ